MRFKLSMSFLIGSWLYPSMPVFGTIDSERSQLYLMSGIENYSGEILKRDRGHYFALGIRSKYQLGEPGFSYLTHFNFEYSSANSQSSVFGRKNKTQSITDIGYDIGLCWQNLLDFCPFIGISSKSIISKDNEEYFRPVRFGLEIVYPFTSVNLVFTAMQSRFGQKLSGQWYGSSSSIYAGGLSFNLLD